MSRRLTPAQGYSYCAVNGGRLTTYHMSQNWLDVKREVEAKYPELECLWDHEQEETVIVETCRDGTQRLVFATKTFYREQTLARLDRADSVKSDPFEDVEAHNARVEKEHDRRFADTFGEVNEKLLWALKKDDVGGILKIPITRGIPNDRS